MIRYAEFLLGNTLGLIFLAGRFQYCFHCICTDNVHGTGVLVRAGAEIENLGGWGVGSEMENA